MYIPESYIFGQFWFIIELLYVINNYVTFKIRTILVCTRIEVHVTTCSLKYTQGMYKMTFNSLL